MIELTTLGICAIHRDGVSLSELATHRQKFALLVYLAMKGPVGRDQLLALFWPERAEDKARHSLSQALYALRRELKEECILASAQNVGLDKELVSLDAEELERLARAERWAEVVDLYRGPFLDQFYLPRAPAFEDWRTQTRTRLARLARRAFFRVALERSAAGDLQSALAAVSH